MIFDIATVYDELRKSPGMELHDDSYQYSFDPLTDTLYAVSLADHRVLELKIRSLVNGHRSKVLQEVLKSS